jgi:glycosyltransferase involved in cell wall biosynthesis
LQADIEKMKVSAVIPTKNNAATIKSCLASLLPYYEQGYISEITVVDAHSSDGTLEAIKSFPVKLLFDPGKGSYAAREVGWRQTTGELLIFMDADTCLGKGFFPGIADFFRDGRNGIVSPGQKAIVTNRVTRAIGEWWQYHSGQLSKLVSAEPSRWSFFQRLYQRAAWGGEKQAGTGGPCYIARRRCLEEVGGFGSPVSGDIFLSRKLAENGWRSTYWLDAPFYHYPVPSVRLLVRQRVRWGKADAVIHREYLNTLRRLGLLLSRLATPVLGVWLALRYRNPFHLFLFPLAHYAWIYGYLISWVRPGEAVKIP